MNRGFLLLLACLSCSGAAAAGLDPAKPPKIGPLKPYRAPARETFALSNGVPVVLVTDRRFPLVTVHLAVRGGSTLALPRDAGLADAMAELLTEGTSKRTARQIAEEADAIGGALSASADKDHVVVSGFSLSENAGRLIALLAESALDPAFSDAEVALRRKNMLEELAIDRSDPEFLASVAFHKKLYEGHPYGITAPTEASIARIDQDKLRAVHRKLFTTVNAFFVVTGDIGQAELKRLLEAGFGGWKPLGELPVFPMPAPRPPVPSRRLALFDRPGSAQSVLILGNAAVTEKDPDYFPLLVANQILGGSFAARLNMDLREGKGYTYDVHSRLETKRSAGAFTVATQMRNEVTGAALRGVLEHLERMRGESVSSVELDSAKNMLVGRFARRLETQAGVAEAILHGLLHDLPADRLDTYVDQVRAVTAADVRRAAAAHMLPDRLSIALVGDASAIRTQLEGLQGISLKRVDVNGDDLP